MEDVFGPNAKVFFAIGLGLLTVMIALATYCAVVLGGKADDEMRMARLLEEGGRKFPGANRKNMIEFLRRDRYFKIKNAANNSEDITEITEDYVMLLDEQKRIENEEKIIEGSYALRKDSLVV